MSSTFATPLQVKIPVDETPDPPPPPEEPVILMVEIPENGSVIVEIPDPLNSRKVCPYPTNPPTGFNTNTRSQIGELEPSTSGSVDGNLSSGIVPESSSDVFKLINPDPSVSSGIVFNDKSNS